MTVMLSTWRAAAPVAGAITRVAATVRRSLKKRTARRRTVAALAALDNRTLNDIGIRRGEILSTVYGTGADRLRGPLHE